MEAIREPDGSLLLDDLTALDADTLLNVPALLSSEDPKVKQRLLPDVHDDPVEEAQWRKYGGGEIEHLFLSRTQIVERGLLTLEQKSAFRFRLRIAQGHERAWLQALNGARLALFVLHELTQADMERETLDELDDDKMLALARIEALGIVQHAILESMPLG